MGDVKTEKERIAEVFIKNIGYVINLKRRQKGYKIDALAKEMGIDPSTLSRYENGKIDIPASAMAYASYVCDFELSEYTVRRQDEQKLSHLFKEIVRFGEEKRPEKFSQRIRKPRYDRTDEQGNIIPTYVIETPEVEKEPVEPPTSEEDEKFELYMDMDSSGQKRHLLMYAVKFAEMSDSSKDARIAVRAMTRCIASDKDKEIDKMLKEYLRKCKADQFEDGI